VSIGKISNFVSDEYASIYSKLFSWGRDNRIMGVGIRNDGSLQVGLEILENNSGSTGEYIKFKTSSGTDRMIINSAGNVGIGTLLLHRN
jgi:hypothetical protein